MEYSNTLITGRRKSKEEEEEVEEEFDMSKLKSAFLTEVTEVLAREPTPTPVRGWRMYICTVYI